MGDTVFHLTELYEYIIKPNSNRMHCTNIFLPRYFSTKQIKCIHAFSHYSVHKTQANFQKNNGKSYVFKVSHNFSCTCYFPAACSCALLH